MHEDHSKRLIKNAVMATILATISPVTLAQTIDGSRDPNYGAALALQTTATNFGNSNLGSAIDANGSELAAAYARHADGNLYLMFTGNLETNYNKIEIFIDSVAGQGQNILRGDNPDVDFNGLNRMGFDGFSQGLTFDTDFAPDYYLSASGGPNGLGTEFFTNYSELRSAGGGNGFYIGASGTATAPFAHVDSRVNNDPANPALGIEWGFNNSNTGGVPDFGTTPNPATVASVVTGVEVKIPLGFLNDSIDDLKVMAFINGSSHDFLASQFLAGLPDGTDNLGEPRLVDLTLIPDNQFFTVTATGTNLHAWTGQPTGNWSNGSRWSQGISPNSANATAVLSSGTSPTIDLDVPVTLNRLRIDSSYTITNGANTLTLGGLNFNAVIVSGGNSIIHSPVEIKKNIQFDVATNASLKLDGEITYVNPNNNLYVEKVGDGTLEVKNVRANALGVYGGTLRISQGGGNDNVSQLTTLLTDPGATLDLTNNGLIVPYDINNGTPMASFVAKVVAGELSSSVSGNYTVGVVDNAALATPLTTFMDQTVANETILIRGTRKGDANLSGNVDFNDLLALAQNYNPAGTGKTWDDGDSNYDGKVDFNDLLPLAQNYGLSAFADDSQSALSLGATSSFASDWQTAWSLASVPEPTTLGALAGLGLLTLARRRRA